MPRADGLQVQGLIAETSILRLEIREVAARRKPTGPLFQDILAHVDLGIFSITVLFGFMVSWTEFVLAWTFLTDPNRFTLAMGLNGMVGQYSSNTPWSDFAAMAILITIPVLILFFLLQRWIVSGLAVGAVKG